MPRRKSYTTAEGFQSLDQHLIAQQMIPLRVEEKLFMFNGFKTG